MFSPWRWIILFLPFVYLQFSYGWLVLDICQYQNHRPAEVNICIACRSWLWLYLDGFDDWLQDYWFNYMQREAKLSSHGFNFGFIAAAKLLVSFFPNTLQSVENGVELRMSYHLSAKFFFSNIFLMFDILLSLKIPTWIANKTRTTLLNYSY